MDSGEEEAEAYAKSGSLSEEAHTVAPQACDLGPGRQAQAWRGTSSVCTWAPQMPAWLLTPSFSSHQGLTYCSSLTKHMHMGVHTHTHTHTHTDTPRQASRPQTQLSLRRSLSRLGRGSTAPEFGLPIPGLTWSHLLPPGQTLPGGRP